MSEIQFTVVIPLYNKAECILKTLESVVAQQHRAHEIILVDDGSTDHGVSLARSLGLANLTVIEQENAGVSAARNTGVNAAKTKYIAFIDADDTWSPRFLSVIADLIEQHPNKGLYATCYTKLTPSGEVIKPKIALSNSNPSGYEMTDYFDVAGQGDLPFMMSSIVVDKSAFHQVGGFPVGEWMGEDQSFFVEMALRSSIYFTPRVECYYHVGAPNSACDKAPPTNMCPFASRLLEAIESKRVEHNQVRSALKYVGAHLCDLAKRNIKVRNYQQALELLSHPACKEKPLHRNVYSTMAQMGQFFRYF